MEKVKHSCPESPTGEEPAGIAQFSLRLGSWPSDQAEGGLQLPDPAMNVFVAWANNGAVRQARMRNAGGFRNRAAAFA